MPFFIFRTKIRLVFTPSYTALRTTKTLEVGFKTDIPNHPLEFISDGYKFTRITEVKNVYRAWQFIVLNKSDKRCKIKVMFKLKGDDSFIMNSSTGYKETMKEGTISEKIV